MVKSVRQGARQPSASIADALFTKVQQSVLGILFGNTDRSYYANEIISLAGSGTGAVQRELARLEAAGLVTVTSIGNQRHYQANPAASVFEALRDLIMKTSGLADVLKAALAPIADEILAAFVYGSASKGGDRATSDVDLLVVSDALSHADLFAVLDDASTRIGRSVNPSLYSVDELTRRIRKNNAFVTRVLSQPKIWLVGTEDDLPAR